MKKKILLLLPLMISLLSCGGELSSSSLPSATTSLPSPSSSSTDVKTSGSGLSKSDPLFMGEIGDAKLEISFLEMHRLYEDSIFIKLGDVDILIDAGWEDEGPYVKKYLEENVTDKKLDVLIVTHPHGDHIGGIPTALEAVDEVGMFLDYGSQTGEGVVNYETKKKQFTAKGAKSCGAYESVKNSRPEVCGSKYYVTEKLSIQVLDTGGYYGDSSAGSSGDANGHSLALIFDYGEFSFYTSGDLTSKFESQMIDKNIIKPVTLYKASHHGSSGSNSAELLSLMQPQMIAISAARQGPYGMLEDPKTTSNLTGASNSHPSIESLKRFYATPKIKESKNVYFNMVNGTMKFITDGSSSLPQFQGSPTTRGYYPVGNPNVWNEELRRYEGKVEGEENYKLSDTVFWKTKGYDNVIML